MVTVVFAYVQTYQSVHIKYVLFLYIDYTFMKLLRKTVIIPDS